MLKKALKDSLKSSVTPNFLIDPVTVIKQVIHLVKSESLTCLKSFIKASLYQ